MKRTSAILIAGSSPEEQTHFSHHFSTLHSGNPVVYANDRFSVFNYLNRLSAPPFFPDHKLPGLILLNFHQENQTALNILHAIKVHPVYFQIPVVILSSSHANPTAERFYGEGCNGFFELPESSEIFYHLLEVIYNFWNDQMAVPYLKYSDRKISC